MIMVQKGNSRQYAMMIFLDPLEETQHVFTKTEWYRSQEAAEIAGNALLDATIDLLQQGGFEA